MSNKAQSLVWDLECPAVWNDVVFQPEDKFVLIAYADHADHFGKSIYPAVLTIARKTGFSERTVQRRTRKLEELGLLLPDGTGPRGSNRWSLPFNSRGDKLTPVSICQGDNSIKSLGDNSLGDNSLGDKLTPKLKELNQENIHILEKIFSASDWWHNFQKAISHSEITIAGASIIISGLKKQAEVVDDHYGQAIRRTLTATKYQGITFLE